MTSHDTARRPTLASMDQDTAQRITRLVFECSASLDLALMAVEDANRSMARERPSARARNHLAGILAGLRAH